MWFGKAVEDFNTSITIQGGQGPRLIAQTSNAFTSKLPPTPMFLPGWLTSPVVWVAYAFFAVPIIISLAKLNVKATKG